MDKIFLVLNGMPDCQKQEFTWYIRQLFIRAPRTSLSFLQVTDIRHVKAWKKPYMGHAEETLVSMQSSFLAICTVASLAHFSRLPCMFIFCGFSISPVLKDNHICNVQFSIFHDNLCQILAVMSVHLGAFFTFILAICLGGGKVLFFLKILFSFCCW